MAAILSLPEDRVFTLPDNRGTLSYMIFGDHSAPADRTVFYNHGMGSSLLDAFLYDAAARARRIRVVGVDRPGSGRSPFVTRDRRVSDWPADILALAAHIGAAERFAMIGISGGGPYTFACIDQIPPERGLVGACVLASAYPAAQFGVEGMSLANRFLFWLCPWSPWLVEQMFEFVGGRAARDVGDPGRLGRLLEMGFKGRPAPDRQAWEHGGRREGGSQDGIEPAVFQAVMVESVRRSLRDGCKGAAWDLYALTTDWGFTVEELAGKVQGLDGKDPAKAKLLVLHGRQDINCPVSMALKAKEVLPDADWRISDDDAHVSILVNTVDEVMDAVDKMFVD